MTGSTTHASSVSPVPKYLPFYVVLTLRFHIDKFDYEQFNEYVIKKRTPVVITGLLDKFKDKNMFSFDYLKHRYYDSEISVLPSSKLTDLNRFDINNVKKWMIVNLKF